MNGSGLLRAFLNVWSIYTPRLAKVKAHKRPAESQSQSTFQKLPVENPMGAAIPGHPEAMDAPRQGFSAQFQGGSDAAVQYVPAQLVYAADFGCVAAVGSLHRHDMLACHVPQVINLPALPARQRCPGPPCARLCDLCSTETRPWPCLHSSINVAKHRQEQSAQWAPRRSNRTSPSPVCTARAVRAGHRAG